MTDGASGIGGQEPKDIDQIHKANKEDQHQEAKKTRVAKLEQIKVLFDEVGTLINKLQQQLAPTDINNSPNIDKANQSNVSQAADLNNAITDKKITRESVLKQISNVEELLAKIDTQDSEKNNGIHDKLNKAKEILEGLDKQN